MRNGGWPERIYGFKVEWREIPRPEGKPYYRFEVVPDAGVLHTTEGATVDGAWGTLYAKASAPHVITGEGRIVACRPPTVQGAALRTNPPYTFLPNAYCLQVEQVARSRTIAWLPPASTLEPTLAWMAWCHEELGIPLVVPHNWPDDLSDITTILATNNTRRQQRVYPREPGWYMHMEVPDQGDSWHWDCGAIRRTEMLRRALALTGEEELLAVLTEAEQKELLALARSVRKSIDTIEEAKRQGRVDARTGKAPDPEAGPNYRMAYAAERVLSETQVGK